MQKVAFSFPGFGFSYLHRGTQFKRTMDGWMPYKVQRELLLQPVVVVLAALENSAHEALACSQSVRSLCTCRDVDNKTKLTANWTITSYVPVPCNTPFARTWPGEREELRSSLLPGRDVPLIPTIMGRNHLPSAAMIVSPSTNVSGDNRRRCVTRNSLCAVAFHSVPDKPAVSLWE